MKSTHTPKLKLAALMAAFAALGGTAQLNVADITWDNGGADKPCDSTLTKDR